MQTLKIFIKQRYGYYSHSIDEMKSFSRNQFSIYNCLMWHNGKYYIYIYTHTHYILYIYNIYICFFKNCFSLWKKSKDIYIYIYTHTIFYIYIIYIFAFFFTFFLICYCQSFFFNFIYFIYLFMAVLGLHFCVSAFSSCGERGPLFIAVRGPLTIAASLVAEHRLQTHRLSNCGSRA